MQMSTAFLGHQTGASNDVNNVGNVHHRDRTSTCVQTRSKGRGRGRRRSDETCNQLGSASMENPVLNVKRSRSMPYGCSELTSLSESLDGDVEKEVPSGDSAISVDCDFSKAHTQNENFNNYNTDNFFAQVKSKDNNLVVGQNKRAEMKAGTWDFNVSFNEQEFAWKLLDDLVDSVKNVSINDIVSVNHAVEKEAPVNVKSFESPVVLDDSFREQQCAWEVLDNLQVSEKTVQHNRDSVKLPLLRKPDIAKVLKTQPKTMKEDNSVFPADDYPVDIETIEAELNFIRDADDGQKVEANAGDKSGQMVCVLDSKMARLAQMALPIAGHMIVSRKPLSPASNLEDVRKAEEDMPSGMYTAKGRRVMFRNFRLSQEDEVFRKYVCCHV